ncbi:MAG: hypothetical protein HS115_00065 [Spirochaetales bacterium]|nr:hypothetical protein [Spirochaetales bacterium]
MPILASSERLQIKLRDREIPARVLFETPGQLALGLPEDASLLDSHRKGEVTSFIAEYFQGNYRCAFKTKFILEPNLLPGGDGLIALCPIPSSVRRVLEVDAPG